MSKMKLAYVAGPYRAANEFGVKCNIERAEQVAISLWTMGYAVICPHKNTAFLGGACPDDVWLAGDLEMVKRCDLLVLVDGWEASSGTRGEVSLARHLEIPVFSQNDLENLRMFLNE